MRQTKNILLYGGAGDYICVCSSIPSISGTPVNLANNVILPFMLGSEAEMRR